ncbi:unnamed protein product [Musa acuminata var. zebrina]
MAIVVIEISSTDEDEEECKKAEMQAKKMATTVGRRKRREYVKVGKVEAPVDDEDEDDDDCFILPYNPFLDDQLDLKRRLYLDDPPLSDDVTVVAERGQVLVYCLSLSLSLSLSAPSFPFVFGPRNRINIEALEKSRNIGVCCSKFDFRDGKRWRRLL